jgi:hypothetical protein
MTDETDLRSQVVEHFAELQSRLALVAASLETAVPANLSAYFALAGEVCEVASRCELAFDEAYFRGVSVPNEYHALRAEHEAISLRLRQVEMLPHLRTAALDAARRETGAKEAPLGLFAVYLDPVIGLEVSDSLFPLLLRQARIAGDLNPLGVVAVPVWVEDWLDHIVNYRNGVFERLPAGDYPTSLLEAAVSLWDPVDPGAVHHDVVSALNSARALLT